MSKSKLLDFLFPVISAVAGHFLDNEGDAADQKKQMLLGGGDGGTGPEGNIYKRGGRVKGKKGKPQLAILHGGERVLTAKQNKNYEDSHLYKPRRKAFGGM